ncbi:hypothetical protein ACFS6H_19905 [Terrimonas rubra]|uniref:Uncharacterized protein n=1 Tax=Terrimonas rubra TaxID=1035890 RepID=A0ABW6AC31_9BACT
MGCDIHLYAEVRKRKTLLDKLQFWKPKKWVNIDKWTKNKYYGEDKWEPEFKIESNNQFYTGGRNYNLFSALCGVRNYYFEPVPKMITPPKGMPKNVSEIVKKEIERYGSDGHSHSWNTLEELLSFDWSEYGESCDKFLKEVLPKMKAQNVSPKDVRIVYFFDN